MAGKEGWRVFHGLCSSSSSSVREMYSSRHSLATSGIENEKLAGNVCMNAAGKLACRREGRCGGGGGERNQLVPLE